MTNTSQLALEKCHKNCARRIQRFPSQTAIAVPLATLGLISVEEMLNIQLIIILYRWLGHFHKDIKTNSYCYYLSAMGLHSDHVYNAMKACAKYGLTGQIVAALETGKTFPIKNGNHL